MQPHVSVKGHMAELLILHEYSVSENCYKVRLAAATVGKHSREKFVWVVLVLLMLTNGVLDYRKPAEQWSQGPNWAAEVRVWRSNRDYPLAAWPRQWTVDLSDWSHACSSLTASTINPPIARAGGSQDLSRASNSALPIRRRSPTF